MLLYFDTNIIFTFMKKQLLIGIIVITFTSIILVIGSPFQITSNNLVQNNGHQQKVYATSEEEDDSGGDDVENERVKNGGIDDGDDNSNNDDDGSGGVDNDNEGGNDGKISDDESDKSDDKSSSEDLFNEELTAENPPEIAGEIITEELAPNFGITDNLQVAPSLSTDDQIIQAPQAAEDFNPNVKLGDLLKEQSQTDSIQEIPFQTTEPPVSKSFDPNVNRLTNSQLEQLESSSSPAVESLNPFVDLDDLLKEQSSTELVKSTGPQLNPSGKENNSESTSTGILTKTSPKNPSDSFISSREPVVIPGPSYSEEDPALEECVVEHCNIPFYNDEICRNGIDDDGDGRVDEDPYCTVVPGKSGSAPDTDDILTPEQSTGPSPFGTK
jgi:hypothetical protein